MRKYAVICQPQAFKIYKEKARKVLGYEAQTIFSCWSNDVQNVGFEDIAGLWYLTFEAAQEPSQADFSMLARHSAFYALFEMKGDVLIPKAADVKYVFEENMPALLNYQGKTNALFTRLMINLASSASDSDFTGKKSLLDPVAGKGTTLYDALMLGYNAYGIEISTKYFEESCHYAAKFMQKAKFKHTTKKDKILDIKSIKISDAYTLEFAPDKKSFAAKDIGIFKTFAADTRSADRLIKKKSIDMIVGDLPYGIHHANKKAAAKKQMARSAEELFMQAMPKWLVALKGGGSMAFSFNEHTTSKDKLAQTMHKNGMKVLEKDKFCDYHHRVDSSIIRNIIVAVKPK